MSESFSAWQIHGAWLALEFIMEYINFSHEMVLTDSFFIATIFAAVAFVLSQLIFVIWACCCGCCGS